MIEVTAAVVNVDNHILAARRGVGQHLAGFWEFPGGKIEPGEKAEDCLKRELKEEFEVKVEVGEKLGEIVYEYGEKAVRLIGYHVRHLEGEFRLHDHDEIQWLELDQLESVEWAPADIPLVKMLQNDIKQKNTQAFYQENASCYFTETLSLDIVEERKRFLDWLGKTGTILDLGCGSGRDSRFFLNQGYHVTAMDASTEMARVAGEYLGQKVLVLSYHDLDYEDAFEGIWACASLLHCPKDQIVNVLRAVMVALKPAGVLYMSFKQGQGERVDDRGRLFNDYNDHSMGELVKQIPGVSAFEIWSDTKILRGKNQTWVNTLLRKNL